MMRNIFLQCALHTQSLSGGVSPPMQSCYAVAALHAFCMITVSAAGCLTLGDAALSSWWPQPPCLRLLPLRLQDVFELLQHHPHPHLRQLVYQAGLLPRLAGLLQVLEPLRRVRALLAMIQGQSCWAHAVLSRTAARECGLCLPCAQLMIAMLCHAGMDGCMHGWMASWVATLPRARMKGPKDALCFLDQ